MAFDSYESDKKKSNHNELVCTKEDSTADEIVRYAAELRELSEAIVTRTYRKLSPVMGEELESGCCEKSIRRAYPPLFEDLRGQFDGIRNCLNNIDDAIRRVEL